jgi:asparagine synthase (glutamine-hydrolysing)
VLLKGLIKWGAQFLTECNGMFALAFWNKSKRELLLARDRMGIKPLYYARVGDQLIFASELRAILKSGLVRAELNVDVLGDYLRYQTVHGSRTIANGIHMLPPGSIMTVNDSDIEIKPFWSLANSQRSGIEFMQYPELKTSIYESLRRSVKRRLVSDVPLGCFLSGGIDSSSLVALAAQESSNPLKTFTISFSDHKFSEAPFAQIVADKYHTDHAEIRLDPHSLVDHLPDAIRAMDHPSGDGINTYVVSKAAKDAGITVVLSGLGGDELFAGYPIFKQFLSLSEKGWLPGFPKFARSIAGSVIQLANPGVASSKTAAILKEDYFDLEYVYQYSREVSSKRTNSSLSQWGLKGSDSVYQIVKDQIAFGLPGYSLPKLSRVSVAEISTYLQSVLLRDTDQMSMRHALEVRVPFLDHELVETVLGVPDVYKYPHTPKKLLVDAMGDLLPEDIVNRPKMGFTFPWDEWMRGELKDFCGDQISNLGKRDSFNSSALSKRYNQFLKGDKRVTWSRIWYLCILEAWLAENGFN